MKFFSEEATVTPKRKKGPRIKQGSPFLFLLLVLIASLTACNQGQEGPKSSDEPRTDVQDWERQEVVLEDGVPYAVDNQGTRTQLGEAIQPPNEWKDQDLGGRNEAATLGWDPDVQGELVSPTDGWLVVTYTRGDTYVYKTSDGGDTWTETSVPDLLYVPGAVGFINKDRLIIAEKLFVGAPVFVTKDGGESWEQMVMPDEKAEVKTIDVTEEGITIVAEEGEKRWEMESLDLGDSWSTVQSLQ